MNQNFDNDSEYFQKMQSELKKYANCGFDAKSIEFILEFFELCDPEGHGVVSTEQMLATFRGIQNESKSLLVFNLIQALRDAGHDSITLPEFLDFMTTSLATNISREDLVSKFSMLDADGSGVVSIADLRSVAKEVGLGINDEDLFDILKYCDVNQDGKLTFEDFYDIFANKKLY